jgi:hypothetical protein
MNSDHPREPGSRSSASSAGIGGRAASAVLRPFADALDAAVRVGFGVERRVVNRVLDGGELEQALTDALSDPRVQAAVRRLLESDGARGLIDSFFDSGLFAHFIDRLVESEALWHLVDEIAQSPSVMAALSQQGLGFADQLGRAARERSRRADHRVEGMAGRLRQHEDQEAQTDPDVSAR